MSTWALIVAGGFGRRMGRGEPKQFLTLGRRPILARTLEVFENTDAVTSVIVVAPRGHLGRTRDEVVERWGFKKVAMVVCGGPRRQDSVWAGLQAIPVSCKVVVIHDGVRPLVTPDIITRSVRVARNFGAALVAIPVSSTIKVISDEGFVVDTPERRTLMAAQTPQSFQYRLIMDAYEDAIRMDFRATDDCQVAERMGAHIVIVPGSPENLKITTESDLAFAELLFNRRKKEEEARKKSRKKKSGGGK